MTTVLFPTGRGLLADAPVEVEATEIARLREKHRVAEAEANKAATELEARYRDIDINVTKYLWPELVAERKRELIGPRQEKDIAAFVDYLAREGFPHLSPDPRPLTGFLLEECEHGIRHVVRLLDSISRFFRKINQPDPTQDRGIRAIVRNMRTEAKSKGNENDKA
jgi:hypothetical protein